MPDVRVQVAYHFTFDPAKSLAELPEEVTRTLVVGEHMTLAKFPSLDLEDEVYAEMMKEMDKLVFKTMKKAKPVKKVVSTPTVAEESGAQGSLL